LNKKRRHIGCGIFHKDSTMKTIIFCADGTWNGPTDDDDKDGVPDVTNVLKLFLALQGDDTLRDWNKQNEQEREKIDGEGKTVQVAKYLHGVGDSSNKLVRMLGGMFGAGVIARIVRGYTFISRNYTPGDKIVLVGFSRGAYTARALGGLIASQGLLNPANANLEDQDLAYRLGTAAWHKHRHETIAERKPSILGLFERLIDDLPKFTSRDLSPSSLLPVKEIYAIAVWDTVGAMGIPRYGDQDERLDTFRFADEKLSAKVLHAFHGVSIDEQRKDFAPTLWEQRDGIKQVLFPGAHADVGGGYSANDNGCGLSDVALYWMTRELRNIGVRFSEKHTIPLARDHAGCEHRPWEYGIFKAFAPSMRQLVPNLYLHESVKRRWKEGAVPIQGGLKSAYRPTNLDKYLDANGDALPGVREEPFD
jgi:uncharacterized protein (DUF2235 family)